MCQLRNGHGPGHQPPETTVCQSLPPPPPERRMGEWVLVHPVFVHHPASGLMKQPDVHRYSRHIRAKSRLPHVPGHSPRREKLAQIIHGHVCTGNHHASDADADGSNSHPPSPSTQCTLPPGTATTVPTPDEHSSCVCPRRSRPVADTGSKSPADCDSGRL